MLQEISYKNGIILEYIDLMLGKRNEFSLYYLTKTPYSSEKMALEVFRFAFEKMLKWTPQELMDYFDLNMIHRLKLSSLVRYIRIPAEIRTNQVPMYILNRLYPDQVYMSFFDITINVYEEFLTHKTFKLPKDFFSDTTDGKNRACICLQYVISHFLAYLSVKELYEVFAINSLAYKLLKAFRLYAACKENYTEPIEYLHDALPKGLKNELFLHFCYFQNDMNNINKIEVAKKVEATITRQQQIMNSLPTT